MYVCEKCKRVVGPYIPEHRIPEYKEVQGHLQIKKEHKLCPFCAMKIEKDEDARRELKSMVKKTYIMDKKEVVLQSMIEDV